MDITTVDNPKERDEMTLVLGGHADMINGDISKEAWDDAERFPRKQCLDIDKNWTFLVELSGDPPLAEHCACLIDLSEEDDRGDVEPFRDKNGIVHCTLGCECDGDGYETREITCVRAYSPKSFNDKFPTFRLISIVDFVRRVCNAAAFDGYTEEDIAELKRSYGV